MISIQAILSAFLILATLTFLCRLKHRLRTEESETVSESDKIIIVETKDITLMRWK